MSALFADTSFWIAFLNQRDAHHAVALRLFQERLERIYVSDWVLVELGNYFASHPLRVECAALIRDLLEDDATVVVPVEERVLSAALDLYQARPDKHWSLTDCASFVIMESLKIRQSLTADHHFAQAGFEILLQ